MTLVGHAGTVRCLHLLGNRLVSGSTDSTIKVWDLSVQEQWSSIACKVTMIGHTDTVRCVQVVVKLGLFFFSSFFLNDYQIVRWIWRRL